MVWLLLSALALAADETEDRVTVLVSEFQPRNTEAKALASLIENFIASRLKENPDLRLVRVDNLPPFEDYPARTYLEGCPKGDIVGCTYVAAERGEVQWAITGTTRVSPGSSWVEVSILDIASGRVVVSFESELQSGQDEKFAQAVAEMLSTAMSGSIKQTDIRNKDNSEEEADMRKMSDAAVAAQLESLSQELGEMSSVVTRSNEVIRRPDYTMDDLADQMQGEGTKPWERLGMSPGEYLKFKNSGKSLEAWRQLAVGKDGQLLIRPTLGFGNHPTFATYYARYAYDQAVVVDRYSANVVQNGFGGFFAADVGYGVHPLVDVGLMVAVGTGRMSYNIQQQTVGQTPVPVENPLPSFQSTTLVVGPRVNATFLPVSPIRPTVGGSVQIWLGDTITNHLEIPEEIGHFNAPTLIMAEVAPGVEARIAPRVDFFLQVPLDFMVGGRAVVDLHEGSEDVLTGVSTPEAGSIISTGLRAGLQIHLFGKKVKGSILDEVEE